jgi:predicted house-cleaning noncanonical NTP pyrophosphatase (MazG superfamily)
MARIHYDKLIRDRIPEIIEAEGKQYRVETMPDDQYRRALLEKLVEEAQEAAQAGPEKLPTELADLYEVMNAVLAAYAIDRQQVAQLQEQRHMERGGFEQRLRLLWVEETDA